MRTFYALEAPISRKMPPTSLTSPVILLAPIPLYSLDVLNTDKSPPQVSEQDFIPSHSPDTSINITLI